jgi:hypothetical protein
VLVFIVEQQLKKFGGEASHRPRHHTHAMDLSAMDP